MDAVWTARRVDIERDEDVFDVRPILQARLHRREETPVDMKTEIAATIQAQSPLWTQKVETSVRQRTPRWMKRPRRKGLAAAAAAAYRRSPCRCGLGPGLPGTPLIMIATTSDRTTVGACISAGADGFIVDGK